MGGAEYVKQQRQNVLLQLKHLKSLVWLSFPCLTSHLRTGGIRFNWAASHICLPQNKSHICNLNVKCF